MDTNTASSPNGRASLLGMLSFFFGVLIAGVGFGVAGLLRRSGRPWAVAGLALVVLAVIAFGMMISAVG